MEAAENMIGLYTCRYEEWTGLDHLIRTDFVDLAYALKQIPRFRREALLYGAKHGGNVLYYVIQHDEMLDCVTQISCFHAAAIADADITRLTKQLQHAEFGVLYSDYHSSYCQAVLREERSKEIVPLSLKEANEFVVRHHRHCDSVAGCKFAVGVTITRTNGQSELIGVAICGRPVSRILDDRSTLEINRVCVEDSALCTNCSSMLYGACMRIAAAMGYKRVITYTLESESGCSLKASGFVMDATSCGSDGPWTGQRAAGRIRDGRRVPAGQKVRWVKYL